MAALGDFNFLYFSGVLFAISVIVIITASFLTPAPLEEQIQGLTYASVTADEKRENRANWNRVDVILTCVVLGLVIGMYLYFSFWLS